MSLGLEASLAVQHLAPKRRRGFINLIGLISILGVAVSVSGVIVVVSVMNGFRRDIRDRIIGTNAHVIVNAYTKDGIPHWQQLCERIRGVDGVLAVSPYFQGQMMLKSEGGVTGVLVQGILPDAQSSIGKLKQDIVKGSLAALDPESATAAAAQALSPAAAAADDASDSADDAGPAPCPLLLGTELAGTLDLGLGDTLDLFTPVFRPTAVGLMPRMEKGRVAGTFETGYYEYDSGMAYMRLADAQRLFDAPGQVNQIAVRTTSLEDASRVRDAIQAMDNGVSFWVADWQSSNQNLFKALAMEKIIMFLILGCMVLVSAVNIVSTLVMVVMEKQKQIGVLRSLGFSKGGVMRVFLFQGLYIGGAGGTLGFALGLGVCWIISVCPIKIPGGGSVYYIENLPVQVMGTDLGIVGVVAFVTCILAAVYPAFQAAALDPVEAIRYE
ncbi:MAG TPA: ABC transporter permease [bacterium]|nr:ABC transporter permease [bacterium]